MSAARFRAALAAGALALVGLAALAGCGPRPTTGSPTDPAPAATGDPSSGTAPPTESSGAAAQRVNLAVYYLGIERAWRESDGSPIDRVKLYREFHRLAAGDGGARARTVAAVAEMLAASAADPDYRTGWPSGARVRDVRVEADTVTVDLAGARRNNVGSEAAHQAVQQLVWTATAASERPRVRLLLDGEPVDELWGHVAIPEPMSRAAAEDVLAHVWLIDPQHGATVGRTVTVHVSGYVHEATVNIRVRQGDRTVTETFVTVASDGGLFGEARTRLTLPAGRYTIEAFAPDQTGRGKPVFLDDHTVTVR